MIRNQCYYLVANGLTMQHHSGHFCKNSSYNININVLQENYTKQMIVLLLQDLALHYVKAQLPCISIDLASLPTNKYIMYGSVIALQFNIPLICNTVSSDNLVWSQFLYQLSQQHTLECTNSCDLILGHACSNRACLSNQTKLYIDWHQKTESNWWVFCFLASCRTESDCFFSPLGIKLSETVVKCFCFVHCISLCIFGSHLPQQLLMAMLGCVLSD